MAKPAKGGGMGAKVISLDDFIREASEHDNGSGPSFQDLEGATEDYQRIRSALRKTKRRRAPASWSVPAEAWAMLLPSRPETTERTAGLGAGEPLQDMPNLRYWISGVLAQARKHQRLIAYLYSSERISLGDEEWLN